MSKNEKKKNHQEAQKPKFYYSIIPDALQDVMSLSRDEKYFWTIIYRWCNNKSSKHPSTMNSMDFLAERAGAKKRTAQRWKARLRAEGWLSERERPNKTWVIILNKKPIRGSYVPLDTSTSVDLDDLIEG
jgi:hypothetical protein